MDKASFKVPTSQTLLKNLKDKVEKDTRKEANQKSLSIMTSPYEDGYESMKTQHLR